MDWELIQLILKIVGNTFRPAYFDKSHFIHMYS